MNLAQSHRRAIAAVAVAVILATAARGGTIRHDKADTLYRTLATDSRYASVGKLTYDSAMGSGVLISKTWVLTAAHCVDTPGGTMIFHVNNMDYAAADWFPHPEWDGLLGSGWDVGLVRLSSPITSVAPAVRYRGSDEVGRVTTTVGYGRTGTGLTGDTLPINFNRAGRNTFDILGVVMDYSDHILMADFDKPGYPALSSWGDAVPLDLEYCAAPGDSGGGAFIEADGQTYLAGITSFRESGPIHEPDGTVNSSYGDVMGWTRVSSFNDWIEDTIALRWLKTYPSFNGNSSWSGGYAPGADDYARFDVATTGSSPSSVMFFASATNQRLTVVAGKYAFDLGGYTYTLMSDRSLVVKNIGAQKPELSFTKGTLNTVDTTIAADAGTSADVTLKFTSGATTTWNNSGSVYVGGTATEAGGEGTLTIQAGTTLAIGGTLKIWNTGASGAVTLDASVAAGNLDLAGGTLTGAGNLTVTGAASAWTGGTMQTATTGRTILAPGAVLAIDGDADKTLAQRPIDNSGTVTWSGEGRILATSAPAINNLVGGVFDVQNSLAIEGDTLVFNNQGTFRKSAGDGPTTLPGTFNNTGTVECQSGTLVLAGTVPQVSAGALTAGTWIARAGSDLNVAGGPDIVTNQATVILDGPGSVFDKINTLADNQGSFSVLGGRDFATAGALVNSGTLTVGADSTLTVNGPYTQPGSETFIAGTVVAAGGTVRMAGTLDIDTPAGGAIDLATHNLILDYTGGASPFAEVLGWVASGLHDGPAGYWDGPGITSSAAAAETLTAVGVIDNRDTEPGIGGLTLLEGEAVPADSVLVKYTWWGDANLDGVVNSNDYDRIDSNWLFYGDGQGTPPGGFRWAVGDFNYDGLINSNDYDKIDTAWLLSGGAILAGGGGPTPTPEPATLALVALGGLALLTRRRRR